MGQKVHPTGFRLGVIKDWQGRWYANRKDYTSLLHEDLQVRDLIMKRLFDAGVSRVEIERSANQMTVIISAAKPGIVIGKSGAKVEELRKRLEEVTGKKVRVTIQEIRQPELDATLVARSVAEQLERRVAFRRAMKQAVLRATRLGAKGIRVQVAGRLGGAEMSRTEWEREGRVPLHTLRADIDFGQAEAHTTFGLIGVKTWIYKGDVLPGQTAPEPLPPLPPPPRGGRGGRDGGGRGGRGRGPAAGGPAGAPAARASAPAPAAPTGEGAAPAARPPAPAPAAPTGEATAAAAPAAPLSAAPAAPPAATPPAAEPAGQPEAGVPPSAAAPPAAPRLEGEGPSAGGAGPTGEPAAAPEAGSPPAAPSADHGDGEK